MYLEQTKENIASELVEQLPIGILLFDDLEISYANQGFCRLLHCNQTEGLLLKNVIAPQFYDDFICIIEDWQEKGPLKPEFESQVVTKRGGTVDVLVNLEVITSGDTKVLSALVKNITRFKIAEIQKESYYREVQVNLEYFDNLFERLPLGAFILDFLPLGTINHNHQSQLHQELGFVTSFQRVNDAFKQLLGYSNNELRGKSILDQMLVSEFQSQLIVDQLKQKREGAKGKYEIIFNHKNGFEIPVLLEAIPILYDPDKGLVKQIIGVIVDQTERKQFETDIFKLNRELQALSRADSLTGLANRRVFDETLRDELARAKRQKTPLSLLMVDIDYFKPYNDTYGHVQGDKALQEVAALLKSCFRRKGDLVARYGGEEFTIILPNTNCKDALRLAEELRARVEEDQIPHKGSHVSPYVTLSIGVATTTTASFACSKELVELADLGLYVAKEQGRNQVSKSKN